MLQWFKKGVDVKRMKKDARERFTLRLPSTLFSKLQINGEELGVSTNALILQILWNWMEQKENQSVEQEVREIEILTEKDLHCIARSRRK